METKLQRYLFIVVSIPILEKDNFIDNLYIVLSV